MREIRITVQSRNHSDTVVLRAELRDSSGTSVLLAHARFTCNWKKGPGEDLGPQEMYELMHALSNEIEGWQAKLYLDY